MGSTPRVSVIVPSYNHSAYLPECLDSVLAQDYQEWELVVVDDRSPDNSFELLQAYAKKDSRIRVFQNPENKGAYATEQVALDLSKGSLIAVLNSDDLWRPGKLSRQVAMLDRHPKASFCYVLGTATTAEENTGFHYESPHGNWPMDEAQDLVPYLVYENRVLASGVLFRREGLSFEPSCRYSGDWVALRSAVKRGYACCVAEELTYWRQHATNSYRFSYALAMEDLRVRRAIQKERATWLSLTKDAAATEKGLRQNDLNIYMDSIVFNTRKEALQAILPSFGSQPLKTIKRALGLLLPYEKLIRYPYQGEAAPLSQADRKMWLDRLKALPPIRF